jgi:glycosyltransferase involved in cell wall biosynthesis
MTDFLVSIVMPCYNSGLYIKKAIDSVVEQTYLQWELIIIDNNSSDNTLEIAKSYQCDKIKIFKINNQGIIAKSRNFGIQKSSGSLIAFLDSDDWWKNNKLAESIKHIQLGNDIVYHPLKIVNKSFSIFIPKSTNTMGFDKDIFSNLIKFGNFIPNSSVVVKKNFLEAVSYISEDENLIAAEDYDCWLKIAKLTNNFYCINNCLGYYLYNGLGSNNLVRKIRNLEYLKLTYINPYVISNESQMPSWVIYFDLRFNFINKNYIKAEKYLNELINKDFNYLFKIKILYMYTVIKINKFWTKF